VIAAGVSKGTYAGPYKNWIERFYFEWFQEALGLVETDFKRKVFTKILVPVSPADNIHFSPVSEYSEV
jgi:hypothetical protein